MQTPSFSTASIPAFAHYTLGTVVMAAAVVGTSLLMTRVFGPLPLAVNQTTTQRQTAFDVSGESELITTPDEAQVSVGISSKGTTVAEAQDRTNTIINDISAAIKKLSVKAEDIKTINYTINPEYDYQSTYRPITGYTVSTNLRVKTTDLAKINQIIDDATAAGATQVNGIQFSLSKAKKDELTNRARKEAINDAQANAQDLAKMAGMRLGRILNVYEQPPYNFENPMPYAGGIMMDKVSAAPTEVQPGSTTFTYRVTLSYETL